MPIAEKGYRPYTGPRLPSRRNHLVIAAMEARRIWASALVKIVVFLSLAPPLVMLVVGYARGLMARMDAGLAQAAGATVDEAGRLAEALGPDFVLLSMNVQLVFAVLMTMAWGSGAIASDASSRSMQFYFAKPVTPRTYLLGKIIPLAVYCSVICLVPAVLVVILEAVLLREQGLAASRLALLLPALLYSAIVGVVLATVSVAVSSMSRSRLLTLSYWASALFLPLAVAWVVKLASRGELQWPYVASLLSMLQLLGRSIFRLEVEGQLQWYHALVTVASLCVGGAFLMRYRLSRPEVVG